MVVGVATVKLYLSEARSLKDKRGVIKSVIQRLRNKFNVSVAEVDQNDIWKNATVGLAVVSKDKEIVDRTLTSIDKFLEEDGRFEVVDFAVEIL